MWWHWINPPRSIYFLRFHFYMSEDGGINLHTILDAVHIWVKRPHICCVWVDLLHIMLSLLISYLTYKWAKDRACKFHVFLKRLFSFKWKIQSPKNIQTWCDGFLVWSFVLYLQCDDVPSPAPPHAPVVKVSCQMGHPIVHCFTICQNMLSLPF